MDDMSRRLTKRITGSFIMISRRKSGVTWPRAGFLALQDQLDTEQAIYRVNIANRQVEKVFSCGEILRSSPSHCIFSGLGLDGSLYVMVERGLTDIYALDLDLP